MVENRNPMKTKNMMPLLVVVFFLLNGVGHAMAEAVPDRAMIRGDGTLLVNGEAMFPIGVRTEVVADLKPIADCGFNMVMGSGEWDVEHYAEADRLGLKIIAGHYVWAAFRGTQPNVNLRARGDAVVNTVMKNAKDQRQRTLEEAVKSFDHLPGVIGWKIGDEPEAKLTEIVEAGYEIIKSYNPQRIVGPILCDRQWLGNFRNAGDVIFMDNYPLRGTTEKKWTTSINETHDRMRRAVEAIPNKSAWYVAPMYPGSYWSLRPEEGMNLQDMRLPVYAGLIAGAKGILFFHWGLLDKTWSKDDTGKQKKIISYEEQADRLAIMKSLVVELKKLSPILCDGRVNDEPDIRWFEPGKYGPGPQLTRVIEFEGKQYLIVMNLLDVPIEGNVFGPDPAHNFRAYDADVFMGEEYLSVKTEKAGEPIIKIAPRGAGVFVLTRRSIIDK